jgi:hypothetical protein
MLKMLLYYPVFPKVTIASSPDYPCIFKKKKRLVYVDVLFLPADPGLFVVVDFQHRHIPELSSH